MSRTSQPRAGVGLQPVVGSSDAQHVVQRALLGREVVEQSAMPPASARSRPPDARAAELTPGTSAGCGIGGGPLESRASQYLTTCS